LDARDISGELSVTSSHVRLAFYREIGRRIVGVCLELGIKAYGAAAAVSVALSDAETVSGKRDDAIAAVPNLMERYRDAKYVIDHQAEIQAAVDYVNDHAPDTQQLEATAEKSTETLDGIHTTYSEVVQAKEAFAGIGDEKPWEVTRVWDQAMEGLGHARQAWEAKPDLDSLGRLADVADQVGPFVQEVEVLVPAFYGGVLTAADNFASDEIVATVAVMAAAVALGFALGTLAGFWARRGRPGLIARMLQRVGARVFRRWYVRNLEYALSPPLYAAATRRIQNDVVADPEKALDPQALERLEEYFERRLRAEPVASSGSAVPSRAGT
jgi:hypothetical protein